jgi:hypothetical protein
MSNKAKKVAKQRKRKQKKKEQRNRHDSRLPLVGFGSCSSPEFYAAVVRCMKLVHRNPRAHDISAFHVRILRTLRQLDHDKKFYDSLDIEKWAVHVNDALLEISEAIFDALPDEIINRYCPDHCFSVSLTRDQKKILVTFTEIIHQSSSEGKMHFSSKMPKVTVNRLSAKIAFSTHAFDRIVERCLPYQDTYNGIAMIHSLFGGKLLFEPTEDNEMLKVYFMTRSSDLGFLKSHPKEISYVLVGYCPLSWHHKEGDNQTSSWVAKTLLVLGMKNTPERKLIESLPLESRDFVFDRLKDIIAFKDIYMLLWFQYCGYPCLYEKVGKTQVLKPLEFHWEKRKGLEEKKSPKESLGIFLMKGLQNYSEDTTIPLP